MTKQLQLYGQFSGYWSNAYVSRGIAAGFIEHGWDVALYDRDGIYEGMWAKPYRTGLAQCDIGAFVGYAIHAPQYLANHAVKIGFFIAESSIVPRDWATAANDCTLVVVPSPWTAWAYIRGGVNPSKVVIASHGLHPCYMQPPSTAMIESSPLMFLHVAGARDFIERKGTPALIKAWQESDLACGTLTIRTPYSAELEKLAADHSTIHFDWHDDAMPPEKMRKYLCTGDWSALIQPSRAEAFGLMPVEARACGIPVIMTGCAGHVSHRDAGDIIIPTGADEAITVNGIPNGLAPALTTQAITAGISRFCDQRTRCATLAVGRVLHGYAQRWRWSMVLEPVLKALKTYARKRPRKLGV